MADYYGYAFGARPLYKTRIKIWGNNEQMTEKQEKIGFLLKGFKFCMKLTTKNDFFEYWLNIFLGLI